MPVTNPDYSNLNHDDMAKNIGLKVKHMPMLIGSFLEETEPLVERLLCAIESNDYVGIRSQAHSIKGSAGNLRFNEIAQMAKELEQAGEKEDPSFEFEAYALAIKKAVNTIKI